QDLMKELSESEKKLKSLYDKRDYFNDEAKVHREMRDDLHKKRRAILDEISVYREKKDEIAQKLKAAKERRNAYNEKARLLRGDRKPRSEGDPEPFENAYTLDIELKKLENQYEVHPTDNLQKERALVKRIDEIRRKLLEVRGKEEKDQMARVEGETVEDEITEYRSLADQEHLKVQKFYEEMMAIDDKLKEYYPTINHLRSESDKKHEEYLKIRKHADSYHQRATELREKVLQMRNERDKLRNEARDLINDQNRSVSDALDDEGALDDAAGKAVELLLKHGKIDL
ncbi:MAG: hypothetical protein KAH57_10060, partial [Thermoplasmata archaeon]|nr:hypothetical protein [Thermoplasmata archaeon]